MSGRNYRSASVVPTSTNSGAAAAASVASNNKKKQPLTSSVSLDQSNMKKATLKKTDLTYLIQHTKYNKQEIKDWYKRFRVECPSGELTKNDLQDMYSRILPKEETGNIVEHLFRIFDRDGNGCIDFKEFVMATDITTSGTPEEKLRWTFKLYDKDSSGTIDMSEMIEVLETVYVMEGVASGETARNRAKQIFGELDLDGDGTLTCDEFIKGCMQDKDMMELLKNDEDFEETNNAVEEDENEAVNDG